MSLSRGIRLILLLGALLLGPAACGRTPTPEPDPNEVRACLTTGPDQVCREKRLELATGAGSEVLQIRVTEDTRYQQMAGFGAAMTDSAAWVITQYLAPEARAELMARLFSAEEGIGISYLRLPVGASDFTAGDWYTYDDLPPGAEDPDLEGFSIAHDQAYILPLLRQAFEINPQLRFMASPWTAPAWMKSPHTLAGGRLDPAHHAAYAAYLARFVEAYEAEGIPIHALTVQNEPGFATSEYPTMVMTAEEQARLLGRHLGPLFAEREIETAILAWDHNWDRPDYPIQVLQDRQARAYVAGSAWHCYAGQVPAQDQVHTLYPDKDVYFTECSGGDWDTDFHNVLVWNFHHLFIGAVRGWARTVLLWNLALDEQHGPHRGGCADCRGVVTVARDGTITYNPEYHILGQVARFVRPGAVRIAADHFPGQLESVAFENEDGSLALVVLNPGRGPRSFDVLWGDRYWTDSLPGQSVVTYVWRLPGSKTG